MTLPKWVCLSAHKDIQTGEVIPWAKVKEYLEKIGSVMKKAGRGQEDLCQDTEGDSRLCAC